MNEKWVEIRKSGNFSEMGRELNVSPVIARILRNRGLESIEEMRDYLSPEGIAFHEAGLLKGMQVLVRVMKGKLEEGKRIRIIGDYDVDGISATFILYKGLRYLGADCDYMIPHRIEDGYGINIRLIDAAHEAGVDTIITCDNGIAARDQTEHANSLGMTMVITDHHEVPFELIDGEKRFLLPNADAIVDPKLPGDTYPFSGICGAFVAFKVIEALAEAFGKNNGEEYSELMSELTEFAALATVCDVMELKDENRSLVKKGLGLMVHSKNKGLRALIKVTGIEDKLITPYHAGFIIGPCLNASGRLDTSLRALELFLSEDEEKAIALAEELKELNESRKEMTAEGVERAIALAEAGSLDRVLVLFLPDCHESLAGIIAGRIREKYSRPTFVITRTENGLKGSGRSVEAYNMYEHLVRVGDELTKYGGHRLAAGISLDESHLESFRRRLNEDCELSEDELKDTVRIDMILPFKYADLNLARELERLEPCGTGNERPLFAGTGITFLTGRIFGKNKNVAKYKVSDGDGKLYELTYFGDTAALEEFVSLIYGPEKALTLHSGLVTDIKLDICYQLSVNTYQGRESAQMVMKYYR